MKMIINTPYCVICEAHNHKAGCGIVFDNGIHICMDCAKGIYDLLDQFFAEELDV